MPPKDFDPRNQYDSYEWMLKQFTSENKKGRKINKINPTHNRSRHNLREDHSKSLTSEVLLLSVDSYADKNRKWGMINAFAESYK